MVLVGSLKRNSRNKFLVMSTPTQIDVFLKKKKKKKFVQSYLLFDVLSIKLYFEYKLF